MSDPKSKKDYEDIRLKIIYILILIFASIPFIYFYWYIGKNSSISTDQEIWSFFGTFIGGTVGPIFSFGSILLVIITIRQQNKELVIQQDTLDQMNEEIKLQKVASEKQIENLEIQRFETQFYNFIKLKATLLESISIQNVPGEIFLQRILKDSKSHLRNIKKYLESDNPGTGLSEKYTIGIIKRDEHIILYDNYFSFIIEIFDYIDSNRSIEKTLYIRLFHLLLSKNEIELLIFYKFFGHFGCEMSEELIKKIDKLLMVKQGITEEQFLANNDI